jgi:hypothetical protein
MRRRSVLPRGVKSGLQITESLRLHQPWSPAASRNFRPSVKSFPSQGIVAVPSTEVERNLDVILAADAAGYTRATL